MTQLSTKSNRFKSGTMGRAILALSSCFWAFGTFYSHADETIPTGMTLSDYSFWMAMQDEKSQKQDIITSSLPSQGGRQAIEVDLYGLTDGAVYLEADSIITYESGLVSASGSVQMRHKTRLIRADNVDFNTDTGEVSAHGNTQTINDDGSVQYADKIFFNDETEQGFSENFATTDKDNAKVFARRIERVNPDVNRLLNVIYTPCKLCQKNGVTQPPSWSISAEKITQRKDQKMVYYNNATLKLHGVPVAYAPFLWSPDPELERASGFLSPSSGTRDDRGFSWEQPYYFALSKHHDLLLSPQINENVNPFLNLTYRRHFYSGLLNLRLGGTHEAYFDNLGERYEDDNRRNTDASKSFRSYILADGRFKLSENWATNFTYQRVNDDYLERTNANLFDRYEVQNPFPAVGDILVNNRILTNQLNLYRIASNSYFNISMVDFQSLRLDSPTPLLEADGSSQTIDKQTRYLAEDSRYLARIAPSFEGYWSPKQDILSGTLTLSTSGIYLKHKLVSPTDQEALLAKPAAVSDGAAYNTARASVGAQWKATLYSQAGVRWQPFLNLRSDVYRIDNIDGAGLDDQTSRTLQQIGLQIGYPLDRSFENGRLSIEPIAQFVASNEERADRLLPNEDSPPSDLDISILLEPNRSSGFDAYDHGQRLDLALKSQWNGNDGSVSDLVLGRSLRAEESTTWTKIIAGTSERFDPYGLGAKNSDWLVSATYSGPYGYAFLRTRIDESELRLKSGEAGYSISSKDSTITARYIFDNVLDTPVVSGGRIVDIYGNKSIYGNSPESFGVYKYFQLYGRHFFTENWGVSARLDRDILTNSFRRSSTSLIYRDDCLSYELVYLRNNTALDALGDGKARTSWLFRLNLATLGSSRQGIRDIR